MDKILERTILIVKPPSYFLGNKIAYELEQNGLTVIGHIDGKIPITAVLVLYKEHYGRDYFNWLCDQMISDASIVYLIEGLVDAIQRTRDFAGPTDPEKARIEAHGCLRDLYSEPDESMARSRAEKRAVRNVVHTPDSPASAKREGEIFFPTAFVN